MKVEIKKTKITSSIFKQILGLERDLPIDDYTSVGWCLVNVNKNNIKFMVLNNTKTGEIRKLVMFYKVESPTDPTSLAGCIVLMNNNSHMSNATVPFSCEEERRSLFNQYNRVLRETKEKGQFYI